MLENLRNRSSDESGFTLVELLVVMLILGILAAIAVPSFFSQREKAQDAEAKSAVRTAQTAMETYATDNGSSYLNAAVGDAATPGSLVAIEPTLADAPSLTVTSADANGYVIETVSDPGQTFIITKTGGTTALSCTPLGSGGCPADGNWGN